MRGEKAALNFGRKSNAAGGKAQSEKSVWRRPASAYEADERGFADTSCAIKYDHFSRRDCLPQIFCLLLGNIHCLFLDKFGRFVGRIYSNLVKKQAWL
jgi:hypothetical protein